MELVSFNPKQEIINHFDNLINRVDIDIEESLEKYKQEKILGELKCFRDERKFKRYKIIINFEFFDASKSSQKIIYETVDLWPESIKVVDYLNQVRLRTIEELRQAQKNSLEYFKLNSSRFNTINENNIDELKSQLFGEKFYFQVLYQPKDEEYQDQWVFSLFTFCVDFYMSPSDINLLE